MAKVEEMIERQKRRLISAKAELESAADAKARHIAAMKVHQHNVNILRLEGKKARTVARSKADSSSGAAKSDFYNSGRWRQLRYKALSTQERRCACCGASPEHGATLHVDHIKPRSTHPELSLDISNLQILCSDCNLGKSNFDDTDFR